MLASTLMLVALFAMFLITKPNASELTKYILSPTLAWPFYVLMGSVMIHSVVVVLATGFAAILHGVYMLSAGGLLVHLRHFHRVQMREGMSWVLALLLYLEALATLAKALIADP